MSPTFRKHVGWIRILQNALHECGQPVDYIYLDTNRAFEQLTGLKDVKGKRATELFSGIKESHPEVFDIYGRVALTGQSKRFEIYFKPLDMWFSISVYSTEREYFVAVFDNITEHKKAENSLRESEERYRQIVTTAQEGILIVDAQGRITYVNDIMADWLGYSIGELLGESVFKFIAKEDLESASEHWKARQAGINESYDFRLNKKDGSPIWVMVNVTPRRDAQGNFAGSIGLFSNITRRKHFEETLKKAHEILEVKVKERTAKLEEAYKSLKESKERLAEAQKIAHIGSWDWNIVENKMYRSDELYHIFRLDPQKYDTTYGILLNYVHPDDRDRIDIDVKEALNGKPIDVNYRIILHDGEERIVHMQGGAIFDDKNTPIQMRGIVQDITERKRVDAMLRQSEERFRLAQQAARIGTFEWNIQTGVNIWTPELEAMYGLQRGEFGKTQTAWEQLIHPDDRQNATHMVEYPLRRVNLSKANGAWFGLMIACIG